ncbi:GNAT domain-containing protein [Alternaria rosae]|uniref:GNAT domain-containing protein n=1 Tax=Alternaria rosae TaxID=1187941 RepID=UPI001E8E3384|nr:GNAT domain-containing protein [Alternaria rosae]KAH6867148.1 GNAT domain-containing protein [Alternaria rosae]
MRVNETILTPRLLLVPYSLHHVPTYHEWMQDEELQRLTASEPLTLPEEYAMQSSWRRDADKLTFIICTSPHTPEALSDVSIPVRVTRKIEDTPDRMIGDVNLFLYPSEDCDDGAGEQGKHETGKMDAVGELEIMIARPDARGKGLAKEALQAFIWYISTSLPAILDEYAKGANDTDKPKSLSYLRVRIDKDNIHSLSLFKTLGFSQVSEPNYFGEVELRSEVVRHGINKATSLAKSLSYGD